MNRIVTYVQQFCMIVSSMNYTSLSKVLSACCNLKIQVICTGDIFTQKFIRFCFSCRTYNGESGFYENSYKFFGCYEELKPYAADQCNL